MSSRNKRARIDWAKRQQRLAHGRDELIKRRDGLIAQIERDFAGVTRDGGVSISEAHVIDDYGTEDERRTVRKSDTYAHWNGVTLPDADPGGSALSFMDPIGFRYHLPAYMCFALRHGYEAIGQLVRPECSDSVARQLHRIGETMWCLRKDRPPTISDEKAQFDADRFTAFNTTQKRCIARFLIFNALADRNAPITNSSGVRWWIDFLPMGERSEARRIWQDPR